MARVRRALAAGTAVSDADMRKAARWARDWSRSAQRSSLIETRPLMRSSPTWSRSPDTDGDAFTAVARLEQHQGCSAVKLRRIGRLHPPIESFLPRDSEAPAPSSKELLDHGMHAEKHAARLKQIAIDVDEAITALMATLGVELMVARGDACGRSRGAYPRKVKDRSASAQRTAQRLGLQLSDDVRGFDAGALTDAIGDYAEEDRDLRRELSDRLPESYKQQLLAQSARPEGRTPLRRPKASAA